MRLNFAIFAIAFSCFLHPGWAAPVIDLEKSFVHPPSNARPWVYWFWLNGNITKAGISADLEAMKRVGIGGALIMEVDQGIPVGPVDFMGKSWRDHFQYVVSEARRLGLEINMNDDAGWNGSGGPWISPAQSMQKVVWSEANIIGPTNFDGVLPHPETVAGFYRDIALLAFPSPGAYRIDNIRAKAAFETAYVGPHIPTNLPSEQVIDRRSLVNLSRRMDENGRLTWSVPEGRWTLLWFGHTSTGMENSPAPRSGRGLECDKLSREGIEANFRGMLSPLIADNHLKPGHEGPGLVATHIDSWENGDQNWTANMRQEFFERRGYDLETYLPTFTGRVVGSLDESERFLWDLRKTISEMVIENYAGRMRQLAHENGLRFTVEAYGSPCDSLPYAGQSDEPMGEFWTPSGAIETCRAMASAAHVYGKPIVGAEAFTSGDKERWREHPAVLKPLGDQAFCEGINRFVFHRYALQPWIGERRPGMTMGPWGQHYERTETWWEYTPAWHEYLARCQFLLRQGLFSADICYLQNEMSPNGPGDHRRAGYGWDECPADVIMTRMRATPGRVYLPDGMNYRLLVLPPTDVMTPGLLSRIQQLVQQGATILGAPPNRSPSLNHYPTADQELVSIAKALWGNCDGQTVKEYSYGNGRVIRGIEPEEFLRNEGVPPDFSSGYPLRFIHRVASTNDIYFVASQWRYPIQTTASFRINGKIPEFWWPETGRIESAAAYQVSNGVTTVSLTLDPSGSVFVVFRKPFVKEDPIVSVARNGKTLLLATPQPPPRVTIRKAVYGIMDDPQRTRDVREKVQRKVDSGENSFLPRTIGAGDDPASGQVKTLRVEYSVNDQTFSVKAQDDQIIHITPEAVRISVQKAKYGLLDDPQRTRDVREKVQRHFDAGETRLTVAQLAAGDDPAFLKVKTLVLEYTLAEKARTYTGTDPETLDLKPDPAPAQRVIEVFNSAKGRRLRAWQSGQYALRTASGGTWTLDVTELPAPQELAGPWKVRFGTAPGVSQELVMPKLGSWSEQHDPNVKYYSGTAVYSMNFSLPQNFRARDRHLELDLGRVEVMARVRLNGKDLGILWKSPFRVDCTEAIRNGENRLEIEVVNLWPNRMIGDEQLPEDNERTAEGNLKSWPAWLSEGKPSPTGRVTFSTWRLWKKDEPLLESGLLGPVKVTVARELNVGNQAHP